MANVVHSKLTGVARRWQEPLLAQGQRLAELLVPAQCESGCPAAQGAGAASAAARRADTGAPPGTAGPGSAATEAGARSRGAAGPAAQDSQALQPPPRRRSWWQFWRRG